MSKKTHVCFLLDETESMLARKEETIQGYNAYIESLKSDEGDEVLFTLTTFNKDKLATPHKAEPIKKVKPLTNETYQPQNWTNLYDAIGTTICAIKETVKKKDLVIFTILTDGEENSSKEYTLEAIKKLIKENEDSGWKFVFLGVGIDAFKGGAAMGLSMNSTFDIGLQNTVDAYRSLSKGTSAMRATYASQGSGATACMNVISEKDREKLK